MDEDSDNLEILEALAKIEDVGDFRLGDFMRQLDMNPTQPVIFYRRLISEARENESFIDSLLKQIARLEEAISQLKARLSSKGEEIKRLKARVNQLLNQAHHKGSERQELEAAASELQEDANNYNLLKELLMGARDTKAVGALSRLFGDLYMQMLYADIGRQPAPDPGRLEKIRQWLMGEFREVLQIPKQELEQEMGKLRAENVGLRNTNTALSLSYWALRQQGWVDTSPDETM